MHAYIWVYIDKYKTASRGTYKQMGVRTVQSALGSADMFT